jgi:thiol-disulfide isomerase/thioredoxin
MLSAMDESAVIAETTLTATDRRAQRARGRLHAALRLGCWLITAWLSVAASSIAVAQSPPRNFVTHELPRPAPTIAYKDEQGRPRSLADFHGKVVLLNIWATWCGSCRREMPALDRLQATLGGAEFEVVALSIDRSGIEAVRKFYAEVGVRNLALYIDSSGKVARELGAIGVPATLLIDRQGREIGRLLGPAEWDEQGIVEFLKRVVAQKASAADIKVRVSLIGTDAAPLNAMN